MRLRWLTTLTVLVCVWLAVSFAQQAPAPSVEVATKTCTVTLSATQPSPGYAAQFQRVNLDGTINNVGTKDASAPFERSTTLTAGVYKFRVVWTLSGAVTMVSDVTASGCPASMVVPTPTPTPPPTGALPLLTAADFSLSYFFTLPKASTDAASFYYGGRCATFNPATGGMYLCGHPYYSKIAEVTIPVPNGGTTLSTAPRATFLQPLTDVFRTVATPTSQTNPLASIFQMYYPSAPPTSYPGACKPDGVELVCSAFIYYDANAQQMTSHFRMPAQLAAGSARGPFQIVPGQAGYVSHWMVDIPTEWRTALGGDTLVGNGAIPIISRTNLGFGGTVLNVADIGKPLPIPATEVLGYHSAGSTDNHPTLGAWDSSGTLFNAGYLIASGVIVPGTRTLVVPQRRGMGTFCYGGTPPCVDPVFQGQGNHAYPYEAWIYLYDLNDLATVKAGAKKLYEPIPYETFKLTLPYLTPAVELLSVTINPATKQIFLVASNVEPGGGPVVYVLQAVK